MKDFDFSNYQVGSTDLGFDLEWPDLDKVKKAAAKKYAVLDSKKDSAYDTRRRYAARAVVDALEEMASEDKNTKRFLNNVRIRKYEEITAFFVVVNDLVKQES